ncbi:MAG: rRNA maturation RNase YbeY [Endomicrobium sp.]|jgi:probable rRNA maturation factor|nr:rRNA maturation RNase YbeY [Endomicrobium sp.]
MSDMKCHSNLDVKFINFKKQDIISLRKIALSTLKLKSISKCQINFVIISDKEIKKLNSKYRNVKNITDVISFLLAPELFIGDIYISKNRSQKQAKEYNNTWRQELAYLIIHGILHFCGYTDYDAINKKQMLFEQDKIFKSLSC